MIIQNTDISDSRITLYKVILIGVSVLTVIIFQSIIGLPQNQCPASSKCEADTIATGNSRILIDGKQEPVVRIEKIRIENYPKSVQGMLPTKKVFNIIIMLEKPSPSGTYIIDWDGMKLPISQIASNKFKAVVGTASFPSTIIISLIHINESAKTESLIVSETVEIPPEYATPINVIEANTPVITLRKIEKFNFIELRVKAPAIQCIIRNSAFALAFDGQMKNTLCEGTDFWVGFTPEEFSKLKDGAKITYVYNIGNSTESKVTIGFLDKTALK